MSTCMARKGFLTLSDCGNPAVTACANCGRSVCPAHLAPQSGFTTCLDCAATQAPPQEQGEGGEYDDVWAHRYRDSYYSSTGYAPVSYGSTHYDRYDASAFDETETDLAEDDVDRGGFGDS